MSSCLVTQEPDYDVPESTPRVIRVLPGQPIARVTFDADNRCALPDQLGFEVRIADRDVGQDIDWAIYVDGDYKFQGDFVDDPPGSEFRRMRTPACISKMSLNEGAQRCKVVTLVITSNGEDIPGDLNRAALELSERAVIVDWQVIVDANTDPLAVDDQCILTDAGTP